MNELNWLYIGFSVVVLWPIFFWVLYTVIKFAVIRAITEANKQLVGEKTEVLRVNNPTTSYETQGRHKTPPTQTLGHN